MGPRIQNMDADQFKTLLENLKWKALAWFTVIKELDPATLAGMGGGLIAIIAVIWALKKVLSGAFGGASETVMLRRDAKKAKKQNDFLRAGELYEMAGDIDAAIKMYRDGKEFAYLGRLYESQKNWSLAGPAFEAAKDYEHAGVMYQRSGKYQKAGEVLKAGNKVMMAAEMFEKAKNYAESAVLYENGGYLQKAANCHEHTENYIKAADLLEKHYLQEKLRVDSSMMNDQQRNQVRSYAQKSGHLFIKAGEKGKAAKIYSMGGFNTEAGEAYLALKEYDKAAELFLAGKAFNKAAELYRKAGNGKKANIILGEMFIDERNYREAARMFEKSEDYLQAGDLYERAGDLKKAGELLMRGGDFTRANEIFQSSGDDLLAAKALEQSKHFKEAAQIYIKKGAYESAARLLEEAGDFYEAGMIFHKLGRIEDTIAFLQKVDAKHEQYYKASLMLGQIFMDRGMFDAARERYKKLISKREIGPETIEPYFRLGLIYEKNRDYANALLLFDKVVAENYKFRDVQNHIELTKEGLRREKAAAVQGKKTDTNQGRYRLMDKIGQGGMGVVYRAEDTVLNRIVAYKVLPPSLRDNPKVLENFLQEAQVAAAINHPNIVTIFDTGSDGVEPYIVMEYIDGITIKESMEKKSPMDISEIINLGKQICHGLDYAHAKNVIHRDIKPANLMTNKDGVLKVMDFGLAKILSSSTLEGTGIQGTPLYMSPEQIEGKRVDQRTDLYSLGCTLYRMATGRPPFIDGNVYHHHLHTPPVPPINHNPKIPELLNKLILKCMEKSVEQRYKRAQEILDSFEQIG